jgi:hypothetical protein
MFTRFHKFEKHSHVDRPIINLGFVTCTTGFLNCLNVPFTGVGAAL